MVLMQDFLKERLTLDRTIMVDDDGFEHASTTSAYAGHDERRDGTFGYTILVFNVPHATV